MNGLFGSVVNCIDGRTHLAVIEWVKFHGGVEFVDLITEPGADGVLANGQQVKSASIYDRLKISVNVRSPPMVAVCGHFDCIGNPVSNEEHLVEIEKSAQVISGWFPDVRVVGLFVNEFGSVDLVCDSNQNTAQMKNYL